MSRLRLILIAAAAPLALAACSKSDTAPRPQHSDVATSMPDAASTPGAVGPATVAPHDPPAPGGALPQSPPTPGPAPQANTADHPS